MVIRLLKSVTVFELFSRLQKRFRPPIRPGYDDKCRFRSYRFVKWQKWRILLKIKNRLTWKSQRIFCCYAQITAIYGLIRIIRSNMASIPIGKSWLTVYYCLPEIANDWPKYSRAGIKCEPRNCELMKWEPLSANHCCEPSDKMRTQKYAIRNLYGRPLPIQRTNWPHS